MHQHQQKARIRRAAAASAKSSSSSSSSAADDKHRTRSGTGTGAGTGTSNRHQLMRQQFYSNNERSSQQRALGAQQEEEAEAAAEEVAIAGRHGELERQRQEHQRRRQPDDLLSESSQSTGLLIEGNKIDERLQEQHNQQALHLFSGGNATTAASATTAAPQAQLTCDNVTHLKGSTTAAAAATTTTTTAVQHPHLQLPKECLQRYNPAYHSASPSMPGGHLGDLFSSSSTSAASLPDGGSAYEGGNSTTLVDVAGSFADDTIQINCDGSNQLAGLMNIRTEELNFSDNEQVWLVKSWPEILARVSFVTPIVLLGLIGNLTIIYSMCRFKPIRSKPTNIFILNMALADLLTTIVCPNAALFTDIFQFYVLGALVCRMEGFIKITCLLVSAYSLIVLSFDWCLSVVRPCRTRITIGQAWLTLAIIWLVSIAMASPLLHWRRLRERHWKDLVEVWCRELIQYTKYYWVCMTLFLIYLPTFVMTIVLIVILAQMDRFEAKLRRSRNLPPKGAFSNQRAATSSGGGNSFMMMMPSSLSGVNPSSSTGNHIPLSSIATSQNSCNNNNNNAQNSNARISAAAAASNASQQRAKLTTTSAERRLNSSLSIGMKYRRRIVKILFFYLLTSIVCWTPLQFTIIYRHFRSEAVPAGWFFELTFYSQLSASLSAAMNPIIFGFLSQPFRRVVTKSWMFRLLDKVLATNARTKSDQGGNAGGGGGGGGGDQRARDQRAPKDAGANMPPIKHRLGAQRLGDANAAQVAHRLPASSGINRQATNVGQQQQEPRLTLDYVEHHQHHHRQLAINSNVGPSTSARMPTVGNRMQHRQQHQHPEPAIKRSRSSTQASTAAAAAAAASRHKRVSFNSKCDLTNGNGIENAAYLKNDDDDDDQPAAAAASAKTTDKTTSFIIKATTTTTTTTTNGLKSSTKK